MQHPHCLLLFRPKKTQSTTKEKTSDCMSWVQPQKSFFLLGTKETATIKMLTLIVASITI